MRSSRSISAGLALLAVVGLGACRGAPPETGVTPAEAEGSATVRIENQSFNDYTIYVVRSGMRMRIGRSTANRTTELTIPRSVVGLASPVSFIADPIGARRAPVSQEIVVRPGDIVTLTIPPG